MEEIKKEETTRQTETNVEKTSSPEQGRQPENSETTAEKSTDISQVDQQEGQMANGELGGNFDTAPASTKK